MRQARVDIVIVNWNAGQQLSDCIDSIRRFADGLVGEVVVVDNGSADGSETPFEHSTDVRLLRTGANLGFARACNLGAQGLQGEFVLFLNPDALLYEQTLARTLDCMDRPEQARTAVCGVQLVDEQGRIARSCARFPTPASMLSHALGIDRLLLRCGYVMADWDHQSSRPVDHVIGAFYLVRRAAFEQVAGFDERFFVYLEDLDLSQRLGKAGWSSLYLADVQAFHAGGGTSSQVKARRLFYSLRSRLLYVFKHFSRPAALSVLLVTLLVEPLNRTLLATLRGSWGSIKETAAAYAMLLRWWPRWILRDETR